MLKNTGLDKEIVMEICKVCKKEGADTYQPSYWAVRQEDGHILKSHYHKECHKEEAREMQIIDANCNDCKFFNGENSYHIPNTSVRWRTGKCAKYNKEVVATVKFCQSNECFEHRNA